MSLTAILILYLAFRGKQVVCDFFLQSSWMALSKRKSFKEGGLKPLCAHVFIHASFTLLLMAIFAPKFWWLALVDFVVHFFFDKLKAIIMDKTGWTAKNDGYWWMFGLDQEAHNLTHLVYIILIVVDSGARLN